MGYPRQDCNPGKEVIYISDNMDGLVKGNVYVVKEKYGWDENCVLENMHGDLVFVPFDCLVPANESRIAKDVGDPMDFTAKSGHNTSTNPKDIAGSKRAPLHLIPPAGAIYGSMACRAGAIKYGPYNWREKRISYVEYLGAIKRHVDKLIGGEDMNRDDKTTHHLGSIIATASILADALETDSLIDDRFHGGPESDLLDRIEETLKQGVKK